MGMASDVIKWLSMRPPGPVIWYERARMVETALQRCTNGFLIHNEPFYRRDTGIRNLTPYNWVFAARDRFVSSDLLYLWLFSDIFVANVDKTQFCTTFPFITLPRNGQSCASSNRDLYLGTWILYDYIETYLAGSLPFRSKPLRARNSLIFASTLLTAVAINVEQRLISYTTTL